MEGGDRSSLAAGRMESLLWEWTSVAFAARPGLPARKGLCLSPQGSFRQVKSLQQLNFQAESSSAFSLAANLANLHEDTIRKFLHNQGNGLSSRRWPLVKVDGDIAARRAPGIGQIGRLRVQPELLAPSFLFLLF